MWNDNETEIDLLGFEDLVDSLEILLTEPSLLPLTVGVMGDWGRGKSSVMGLAHDRLANEDRFLTVEFNPWRFEDSEQVKVALMNEVLSRIEAHIADLAGDDAKQAQSALDRVKALFGVFRRIKWRHAAGVGAAGAADLGAIALGLPPVVGATAGALAKDTIGDDEVNGDGGDASGDVPDESLALVESVAQFHDAFEALLERLTGIEAVVVFVDDLDRCEEGAVIDTFETIRLFLNAPKTAYVLGLNQKVIVSALEERYPRRSADSADRAQQYLEKMIQHSVEIPALSQADVRTYVSLLYAGRHLSGREGGSEQFDRLRAKADAVRQSHPGADAMNVEIAREVLAPDGSLDAALEESLVVAAQIGGPLASGTRGNPRQVKRFLNRLELRRRLATKRSIELKTEVLAKLMVLEEDYLEAFETLFLWQTQHDGLPPHVEVAQALAANQQVPAGTDDGVSDAVKDWLATPGVASWVSSEPSLVGDALGPYFVFSRNKLTISAAAIGMTPEQQQTLAKLISSSAATQSAGVAEALAVPADVPLYVEALLPAMNVGRFTPGTRSLFQLAADDQATRDAVIARLREANVAHLHPQLAFAAYARMTDDPAMRELAKAWLENPDTPKPVKDRLRAGTAKKKPAG